MKGTASFLAILWTLLLPIVALEAMPNGADRHPTGSKGEDVTTTIDVNNIEMFVTNIGAFAYDVWASRGQYDGLYYPKGTDKTAVYASGLWIGAKVNDTIRVAVAEYSQEYGPGKMIDHTWDDPDDPRYRVYKIERGDTTSDDYRNWPAEDGAPLDSLGKPHLIGDQTLWCVYNDADPSRHTNMETDPLGLEVQQTTFAFNRTDALGYSVFLKFVIINKGLNTLDSTYIALWSDPDLGGASDDLVGCDTTLSLGYCYNATNNDNVYLRKPPAVGYDFFQGPIVPSPGDTAWVSGRPIPDYRNLPMTSFNKYINGTDPLVAQEVYWYMTGLDAVVSHGGPYIDPTTGNTTTYVMSGDPVQGTGWLDSDPADRRMMLSSGPFTMAPGDTQEVVAAIIVGQGKNRLSSISALKFYDQFAQHAFDQNFQISNPPWLPAVTKAELDEKVVLIWDDRAEAPGEGGYQFEGYNLYQGESLAGPWHRVATYDKVNGVAVIYDDVFDPDYGVVVHIPVQFGLDSGLRHYIEITDDELNGEPLINGNHYYYALTAYSYNPQGFPKTLETRKEPIVCTPIGPINGWDYSQAWADSLARHTAGLSTGSVVVKVVDPSSVTGHTYQVIFRNSFGQLVWELLDLDQGETILSNQTNQSGDENYLTVDGLSVKVIGPDQPELQEVSYVNINDAHPRGLSWVNWGLCCFGGAAGYGINFFGSTLDPETMPDSFCTVELEFSNDIDSSGIIGAPAGQMAYKYDRPGYAYTGFYRVPFTLWKVVNGYRVLQLNACFVEWTESAVYDSTWDPDATDWGGREYLFIMKSQYDENGGIYDDTNWGPAADVLYAGGFRLRGVTGYIDQGDILRFLWAIPNGTEDVFEFSTNPPEIFSGIKGDVDTSGNVDIADVILTVHIIVGIEENPTGQQIYLADFNNDLSLNIADVIGIVQSILGLSPPKLAHQTAEPALVSLPQRAEVHGDSITLPLEISSESEFAGLQAELNFSSQCLSALPPSLQVGSTGISLVYNSTPDGRLILLAYDLSGKTIDLNSVNLNFRILKPGGSLTLERAILVDDQAKLMDIVYGNTRCFMGSAIPQEFALLQNYPNPFNANTVIRYQIATVCGEPSMVTLRVYNLLGQEVRTLINRRQMPGEYQLIWNGRDGKGEKVASGVYFYLLKAGRFVKTKKLVLLK